MKKQIIGVSIFFALTGMAYSAASEQGCQSSGNTAAGCQQTQTPGNSGGNSNNQNTNQNNNQSTGVGVGIGVGVGVSESNSKANANAVSVNQNKNSNHIGVGVVTGPNTAYGGAGGSVSHSGNSSSNATGGSVVDSGNSASNSSSNATGGSVSHSGNSASNSSSNATGGSVVDSGNSTSTSGVTNAGNSQNTNNVSTGGNSQSSQTNVVVQGDNHQRNPVSSAWAAPVTATNGTCMGSSSAGAQGVTFGVSMATTWRDEGCDRRYNSMRLESLGLRDAAVSLMCQDESVKVAMESAGTPCPVTKEEPESTSQTSGYQVQSPYIN